MSARIIDALCLVACLALIYFVASCGPRTIRVQPPEWKLSADGSYVYSRSEDGVVHVITKSGNASFAEASHLCGTCALTHVGTYFQYEPLTKTGKENKKSDTIHDRSTPTPSVAAPDSK